MPRQFILILLVSVFAHQSFSQSTRIWRLIRRENFERAESFALEKLENLTEKDRSSQIEFMLATGRLYETLGELQEAQNYLNQALSLVQEKIDSGEKLRLKDFDVIDEVALFYIQTGNLTGAKQWIDFSLQNRVEWYNKRSPTNYRPYLALGLWFYRQNQLDSAEYYIRDYLFNIRNSNYTNHLEINRYADGYQFLSEMALERGNLIKARSYARKAVRLQDHSWTKREAGKNTIKRVKALNTLSQVFVGMEKWGRAKDYSDRALKLYLNNIETNLPILSEVWTTRAELLLKDRDIFRIKQLIADAAENELDYISSNFSLLSEYEKENFHERNRLLFNQMNRIMIQAMEAELVSPTDTFWLNVLDYNARTKGLILNESTRLYSQRDVLPDSLQSRFEAWKFLKNQYAFMLSSAKYKNEIQAIENTESKIIELERILLSYFPRSTVEAIPLDSILDDFTPRDKLIELVRVDMSRPFRMDDRNWMLQDSAYYMVFELEDIGFRELRLIRNGLELETRAVNNYNNSIKFKEQDDRSYGFFWEPLGIRFEEWGRVFISADGIYNLVNLDNLWDPAREEYIFQRGDIINITSMRRLGEKVTNEAIVRNACLVGNPVFEGYMEPRPESLPQTALEINDIEVMLNAHDLASVVLMGEQASESRIKELEDCSILHIATHGIFKRDRGSRNPMLNSGLLLTPEEESGEDGMLTAYEASSIDLSGTRVAILSACDTGLGEVQSGEGVYGLQRAFEVNGVDYTLMSMWKVDDEATRIFMRYFYEVLIENQMQPYRALKDAREKMLDKYPERFYWGAFKLVGTGLE